MLILASSATRLPSPVTISGLTSTRLAVLFEVELVERLRDLRELLDLLALEPEAVGEHAALRGLQTRRRMHVRRG